MVPSWLARFPAQNLFKTNRYFPYPLSLSLFPPPLQQCITRSFPKGNWRKIVKSKRRDVKIRSNPENSYKQDSFADTSPCHLTQQTVAHLIPPLILAATGDLNF